MRRPVVLLISLLSLAGALLAATIAPASAHRAVATRITIVRPVTAAGHAAPGFTVTADPGDRVYCDFRFPSLSAVSPNIEWCSPTALSPVACWKAAAAHRALCMLNPRTHNVVRYGRGGPFAPTALAPARQRAPLAIVLGDGDYCSFRAGGAWSSPPGHPHLIGYYGCRHDGAVWALLHAAHYGINESQPTWTVRTAQFDSRHVVTRRVAHAWFVGTAAN
jgi:hypothetical protein